MGYQFSTTVIDLLKTEVRHSEKGLISLIFVSNKNKTSLSSII